MKKFILLLNPILFGLLLCLSCAGQNYSQTESETKEKQIPLSVVNWNVQTFFDANKDGCEYKEFQKSNEWNKEKYQERVRRLAQAISTLDADIYIFEEIENENVMQDITNELSGKSQSWNQKKFWNYSVFSKPKETAIGIGILSRYPFSAVKTHSMDIQIHKTKQPSTRYMLEATVQIQDSDVIILANHWKSKSGGKEQSEIWRDWQECILGKRLIQIKNQNENEMPPVFISGDFNRDSADFINRKNKTFFRYASFGKTDYISADSLWYSNTDDKTFSVGSYFYHDSWERIDNIFILGGITSTKFEPSAVSPWANSQGIPIRYKTYSSEGWSDHLPITAELLIPHKTAKE